MQSGWSAECRVQNAECRVGECRRAGACSRRFTTASIHPHGAKITLFHGRRGDKVQSAECRVGQHCRDRRPDCPQNVGFSIIFGGVMNVKCRRAGACSRRFTNALIERHGAKNIPQNSRIFRIYKNH